MAWCEARSWRGEVGDVGRRVGGRRRRWPAADKAAIVAESFVAGAKVSEVAARHGVNANMLSTWRRQAEAQVKTSEIEQTAAPKLSSAGPRSCRWRCVRSWDGRRMRYLMPGLRRARSRLWWPMPASGSRGVSMRRRCRVFWPRCGADVDRGTRRAACVGGDATDRLSPWCAWPGRAGGASVGC